MALFPSPEWLTGLMEKLNSDQRYAQIARNWEGDMLVLIEAGGNLSQPVSYYLDLWHGKCRDAFVMDDSKQIKPVFTLRAPYENYIRLLKGELDPMQAMLTRKLSLHGNMTVMMRNVPTVLDFVRCCREITDSYV
jgi:putative sterol carrier protein